MRTVEVQVDYALEGDETLESVTGEVYADAGPVTVTRVADASHENGGHPVLAVAGTPPRVLAWLLDSYGDDLAEALEILGRATEVGAPDRASVPARPAAPFGYGGGRFFGGWDDFDTEAGTVDWVRELGATAVEPTGEGVDHGIAELES